MLELLTSKIAQTGGTTLIRVSLFYSSAADGVVCAASTYTLNTLRSEDDRFEVAQYLVRQVRPQAGAHVAVEVAEMIANSIKEYE